MLQEQELKAWRHELREGSWAVEMSTGRVGMVCSHHGTSVAIVYADTGEGSEALHPAMLRPPGPDEMAEIQAAKAAAFEMPAGAEAGYQPADGAGEEYRIDSSDGLAYPLHAFIDEYGGNFEPPPAQWRDALTEQEFVRSMQAASPEARGDASMPAGPTNTAAQAERAQSITVDDSDTDDEVTHTHLLTRHESNRLFLPCVSLKRHCWPWSVRGRVRNPHAARARASAH